MLVTGDWFCRAEPAPVLADLGESVCMARGARCVAPDKRVTVCRADILDLPSLKNAVESCKPKYVFHLAGKINPARDLRWRRMFQFQSAGTLNAESLAGHELESFVLTSTTEIYGNNKKSVSAKIRRQSSVSVRDF